MDRIKTIGISEFFRDSSNMKSYLEIIYGTNIALILINKYGNRKGYDKI